MENSGEGREWHRDRAAMYMAANPDGISLRKMGNLQARTAVRDYGGIVRRTRGRSLLSLRYEQKSSLFVVSWV